MKLTWYGHASFGITSQTGTHTVTDPYDPETSGYKPFSEAADIIVVSSETDDFHCNHQLVPKKPDAVVINALTLAQESGVTSVKGVTIQATEAQEATSHRDYNPDANGMYRMAVDGLHIGHMGDMGNALNERQLEFFQGTDIMLALTGGYPTIALDDLKVALDIIRPSLIVPMHFRTLRYKPRNSQWIQTFLNYFSEDQVDFACDASVTLTRQDLPDEPRVLVLTHV
jgi:L-ascorbate metabolism protein UlaG (beta-lactamase superfamily)